MARVTKAQLEERIEDLESELKKYRNWLLKSEEKYNTLLNEREGQLTSLPAYQQMQSHVEQLELINKNLGEIIQQQRDKIEKLQLQADKAVIPHNARNAGRKPKNNILIQQQLDQITSLAVQGYTVNTICDKMGISRATFYRLKAHEND